MTSYKLFVVCVVLCTVQSVHSYSIRGTIQHKNGAVSEVEVLNYINGDYWGNIRDLTLDRLVDAEILPTLTVANFQSINNLTLTNIALEYVPVFVKTSCKYLIITGNKIKSIPANVFSGPRAKILNLSNNEIQSMADRSVNIGASDVSLSCNKLTRFSQSWFEDPGNIQSLKLDSNRIVYIQDRAFNQMTRLKEVHLGNNHITSIGSEAFSSVIVHLDFRFNNIAQLTQDMFADRDEPIVFLHLHHNQLSYLPEALFLKVKPQSISLFGNPWQCQCLRDIERWLRELNSTRLDIPARRGEPVCVVPLSFHNICVPAVNTDLQQTYARGLSPVQGCWASPCQCKKDDRYLTRLA